jgi:hypothetical protein
VIAQTDHRHGTRAGYIAGCRQPCCGDPHRRYQKRSRLRLLREGTQIVPAHRVLARALWWRARGVSLNGICAAAGVGFGTLDELVTGHRDVCLKSTERAILAVTWDDLPDTALCYADLTRLRVFSLMAAGHRLEWICEQVGPGLPLRGKWRTQDRVTVGVARRVLNTYQRAPLDGPNKQVATKARNRGHRHPLAWDDPEVPAMPTDWSPFLEVAA